MRDNAVNRCGPVQSRASRRSLTDPLDTPFGARSEHYRDVAVVHADDHDAHAVVRALVPDLA